MSVYVLNQLLCNILPMLLTLWCCVVRDKWSFLVWVLLLNLYLVTCCLELGSCISWESVCSWRWDFFLLLQQNRILWVDENNLTAHVEAWTVARHAPLFMGLSQAKTLEWTAISFSRGSSQIFVNKYYQTKGAMFLLAENPDKQRKGPM